MSIIPVVRDSYTKVNFMTIKSQLFDQQSNIREIKYQHTDQMSNSNIKYDDNIKTEMGLANFRTQRLSDESIKFVQEIKNQKGRSNLQDNIKMKVEDYMSNNKLSDINQNDNQHLSFINHKSSILNEIEDVKDILNTKSQMTLYMQSLNNPKYSLQGLLNSNTLIKNNNNNNISKRQIITSSINNQTDLSYEKFTALLGWEQIHQKYGQRYLLSQDSMDSVQYTNQREQNNSPLIKRKKIQSLHLSPRDQSNINTPIFTNNQLLSNKSEKNLKWPNCITNQSPKILKKIKLADLNLNMVKARLDKNASPLTLEDQALQQDPDQILSNDNIRTLKNSSFNFNKNDRWWKKFLTGTHNIKQKVNLQSNQQINLNTKNSPENNHINTINSVNNKNNIILQNNQSQNINNSNTNVNINNLISNINSYKNKIKIRKLRDNSEEMIKIQYSKNIKLNLDINFSPKILKLPKLKSQSLHRVETEKLNKINYQLQKNA